MNKQTSKHVTARKKGWSYSDAFLIHSTARRALRGREGGRGGEREWRGGEEKGIMEEVGAGGGKGDQGEREAEGKGGRRHLLKHSWNKTTAPQIKIMPPKTEMITTTVSDSPLFTTAALVSSASEEDAGGAWVDGAVTPTDSRRPFSVSTTSNLRWNTSASPEPSAKKIASLPAEDDPMIRVLTTDTVLH